MVLPNRIVQVPMDQELLAALDELSRTRGSSRSAIIRWACREYLQQVREEALDQVYERGYQRVPEDTAVGQAQTAIAAQTLPEESW